MTEKKNLILISCFLNYDQHMFIVYITHILYCVWLRFNYKHHIFVPIREDKTIVNIWSILLSERFQEKCHMLI